MATIRKRGPYQFEVQIRRKGYPTQTKTFSTEEEAEVWAAEIELEMKKGSFVSRKEAERTTVKEALNRYKAEITPAKKGAKREEQRIEKLKREPWTDRKLAEIRGADLAKWRDDQLKAGLAPNTVRLYLTLISHLYTICRKEWGMPYLDNPASHIRKPSNTRGRDRRLIGDEEERLLKAAASINPELEAAIIFAIETGMRRGEMLGLRWSDIRGQIAQLDETKTMEPRTVPLSSRARAAIAALPRQLDGRVFAYSATGLTHGFARACRKAGIVGLRFHDLRHEATSRFFEKGLSVMEVASITGHKTMIMLKRYTQLQALDLARKLG